MVGKMPWRRERLPALIFWSENSVDCIVHGITESDTTEQLTCIHRFSVYPAEALMGSAGWAMKP